MKLVKWPLKNLDVDLQICIQLIYGEGYIITWLFHSTASCNLLYGMDSLPLEQITDSSIPENKLQDAVLGNNHRHSITVWK